MYFLLNLDRRLATTRRIRHPSNREDPRLLRDTAERGRRRHRLPFRALERVEHGEGCRAAEHEGQTVPDAVVRLLLQRRDRGRVVHGDLHARGGRGVEFAVAAAAVAHFADREVRVTEVQVAMRNAQGVGVRGDGGDGDGFGLCGAVVAELEFDVEGRDAREG